MNKIAVQILLRLYDSIDAGTASVVKRRALGFNYFMRQWKKINAKQIRDAFRELDRYKLIKKKNYEGSILVSLTEKGILKALSYNIEHLQNKKEKWDKKWRMIAFDIPIECVKGRKALVYRLKAGGFYEMQKSIFLCPYNCEQEVMAIVKLFKLENYVRFGLLEFIDNQENLKRRYKLI